MAVTTWMGANSAQVSFTSADTPAVVAAAIGAVITSGGWSVYDASAGASKVCYRAPCVDGVAYKYVVLDWATTSLIQLSLYESWNSGTHVGTNLAYRSDGSSGTYGLYFKPGAQGAGFIAVFVNARWLALHSFHEVANDGFSYLQDGIGDKAGGDFIGVFETTRDNLEDSVPSAYIPVIWMMGSAVAVNASQQYVCAFTKLRDGTTGQLASQYTFLDTGTHGWYGSAMAQTSALGSYGPSWELTPEAISGRCLVHEMKAGASKGGATQFEVRGKVYGLKAAPRYYGSGIPFVHSVNIKVDANYWLNESTGTFTGFWVFGSPGQWTRWALPI